MTRFPLPPTISKGGASLSGQGSGVLGSSYYCVQRRGRALACFVKSTLLIFDVAIQQQPMGAIEIVGGFWCGL